MDVNYRSKQWENTRESIRSFIELGVWGKGGIDTMKDVTKNLEKASDAVDKYDPDGVVSFSYTSDKDKYQRLYEDYLVLEKFTADVGTIVEDTIDQPFYEDIDEFVQTVRDASISNYTTKNHIGAVEVKSMPYGYGAYSTYETEKTEISIDDILSGDNYYADQIKAEFEKWKVENPDEDISEEDYRTAAVNTRAFEYESIEDDQFTKEFWINMAALVVTVAVTVVCPPAGAVLGAAYASVELGSAISGKDWASGRELDTSERVTRGILAPLDIIPVNRAVTGFSGSARTGSKLLGKGDAITLNTGKPGTQGINNLADDLKQLKTSSETNKLDVRMKSDNVEETGKVIEFPIQDASKVDISASKNNGASGNNVVSLQEVAEQKAKERIRNSQLAAREQDKVLKLQKAAGAENLSFSHGNIPGSVSPIMMRNSGTTVNSVGPVKGSADVGHVSGGNVGRVHSGGTKASGVDGSAVKGTGNVHCSEIDEVIKKDYDLNGNLVNRSIVPKGYDSMEDFLKVVDDATIKEFGYDSVEEFKLVVGHVDDYLNASPKNNIVNKGLAGGKHVKGVDYDVLGFPIFKGDDLAYTLKLDKEYYIMKDTDQFKECTRILKEAIEKGEVPKDIFNPQQIDQIEKGRARIKGFTWHHHQVPGKMQLVLEDTHGSVSHLGGNKLWGEGIR
ncbi:DNase/tRNase domain of colicin-like bacteriocin [Terribacillus halophilus]|uniref:DNase/tRNase domain of colicin-like bacteriocin n=1 Tax=Terribacillus halophilus TaxID=361279 RepID=A0A1G6PXB0_9BACI|nr:HNH endonuclease [Terribacillus halophilus]SDC84832.1 DNase/tRNase domain of colicin-like bacteriocin [Terribacillus halophilus]